VNCNIHSKLTVPQCLKVTGCYAICKSCSHICGLYFTGTRVVPCTKDTYTKFVVPMISALSACILCDANRTDNSFITIDIWRNSDGQGLYAYTWPPDEKGVRTDEYYTNLYTATIPSKTQLNINKYFQKHAGIVSIDILYPDSVKPYMQGKEQWPN
jgi:hypothetical protein